MAGKQADKPPKQLKQDRLVEQLVPDPSSHQPTIQLTGWLGNGGQEGTWRLYLTPQLDEYVQFSEDDVVHSEPIQPDPSALGGSRVWLKSSTPLQHTRVMTRQVQAGFLSGGVTSAFLGGTVASFPAAAAGRVQPAVGTAGYTCSANPHIPACRPVTDGCYPTKVGCSLEVVCGSGTFCPSREFVCGATVGCTAGQECSVGCAA